MNTKDFDYHLPPGLIAQHPLVNRDQSRLLVLHRASGQIQHQHFHHILHHLAPPDVLVLNNSRVIPARLRGVNAQTGGEFEILLLHSAALNDWWVMLRPGRRARVGTAIQIRNLMGQSTGIEARVTEVNPEGHRRLQFHGTSDILSLLDVLGEMPLPPYIKRAQPELEDRERYQTVFAQEKGSVAAPTAGLHFTPQLLQQARDKGIGLCYLTLHVGLGTFSPVKTERLEEHVMHEEWFSVSDDSAAQIEATRQAGGRVVAVGTTTVRVLESVAAAHHGRIVGGTGRTRIYIYPPYRFGVVDALLTNFHLPRSTLLMLVSAFAAPGETGGRKRVLNAYAQAVREGYRFFSYGDAMLIL